MISWLYLHSSFLFLVSLLSDCLSRSSEMFISSFPLKKLQIHKTEFGPKANFIIFFALFSRTHYIQTQDHSPVLDLRYFYAHCLYTYIPTTSFPLWAPDKLCLFFKSISSVTGSQQILVSIYLLWWCLIIKWNNTCNVAGIAKTQSV